MESIPQQSELFIRPDFNQELGEFERVAKTFGIDESALLFLAEEGGLVTLSEEVWQNLENTDSFSIGSEDWEEVSSHASASDVPRDWQLIKDSILRNESLPAPIILKQGDAYHLVSGNTRLMVSRAMGLAPKIWMFEIN